MCWPYRTQEPLIKPALALLNAHGADFDAAQVNMDLHALMYAYMCTTYPVHWSSKLQEVFTNV